jgi:hypothetical protein
MQNSTKSSIYKRQLAQKSADTLLFRPCLCPGCNRHITRLEEINAQLAQECDRLDAENTELRRALARKRAA